LSVAKVAAGALGFSHLLSSWDDTLSGFPLRRLALPCVSLRCAWPAGCEMRFGPRRPHGRTNLSCRDRSGETRDYVRDSCTDTAHFVDVRYANAHPSHLPIHHELPQCALFLELR
jgi:hypothetical protein